MVRDAAAREFGRFGGSDMEAAVKLEGIAIDDLARKFFAKAQRESAFAGAGGSGDDNQGRLRWEIHFSAIVPRRSVRTYILMMEERE
jgi:hypothetical protein